VEMLEARTGSKKRKQTIHSQVISPSTSEIRLQKPHDSFNERLSIRSVSSIDLKE